MATLWKWIKRMFWLVVILVMFTYSTRGPCKSKFDNAWNNMKYTITRLTGHEFKASPPPAVATPTSRTRGPNGETPEVTRMEEEETLLPCKWLTIRLSDGRNKYRYCKIVWKSGPIYVRYLGDGGRVILTTVEDPVSKKEARVDNSTLKFLEKPKSQEYNVQGVVAMQVMATGQMPVKIRFIH